MPESYPAVIVIGMNASTADALHDDPTIQWVSAWSRANSFFRVIMLNVCAWVETKSRLLRDAADPVGSLNLETIRAVLRANTGPIILAYGQIHRDLWRAEMSLLDAVVGDGHRARLHVFRLAKDQRPWHPLYLPRSVEAKPVDVLARNLIHRRRPIRQPFYVERAAA